MMDKGVYTFRIVAEYVQRVANIDIGKELLGINLSPCLEEKLEDIISLWNSDQISKSLVHDYLIRNNHHEFALEFVKQCGHVDQIQDNTLEKVISSVNRSSSISTDDLVYKYLVDTGYDDIAKDLSKLRDCRSINNGLSLQKVYEDFTKKNRKALKRKITERTLCETSLSDKKFRFKSYVEEKEYDELIRVSEAFESEIKNFVAEENSLLDYIIENLLKLDMKVPFICLKIPYHNLRCNKELQLKYPKIRIGYFTKIHVGNFTKVVCWEKEIISHLGLEGCRPSAL